MPCWSRETSTVEFSAGTDPKLLGAALKTLGYSATVIGKTVTFAKYTDSDSITGTFQNGTMRVTSANPVDQNEFKRAYSAEVVKSAAQRFGWQAKQAEPNKFTVTRRA